MSKSRLTREQEEMRLQGLRILAHIIARHYLANPDLYHRGPTGNDAAASGQEDKGKREDAT